jgi:hypothetical protein
VNDCRVIGTEDRIAKLIDDLKKNGRLKIVLRTSPPNLKLVLVFSN